MTSNKRYWFKRRRFGYGWMPVTTQGWLVIAIYIAIVGLSSYLLLKDVPDNTYQAEVGYFLAIMAIATSGMIYLAYKKGPKPKWRWGKKDSDNPEEDW